MIIEFYDYDHEKAYANMCSKICLHSNDVYHSSLFYLLTLDEVCRKHLNEIYDFEDDCIIPSALNKPWQTSHSLATIRLAFNLWNGYCYGDEGEISRCFSVNSIFGNCYSLYYIEALKLRYPTCF